MIIVYTYDSNGFYVSQRTEDDSYQVVANETEVEMPAADFHQPKFDSTQNKWVEGKTPAELFQIAQNSKILELESAFNNAMAQGFSSSALGVSHTYPSDINSMILWNATMLRFDHDSSFASVSQRTLDAGYLDHNKDQFTQAFIDGHQYGLEQDAHFKSKVATVKGLSYPTNTVDDVFAVTW